jgi:hypothetical protein
LILQNLKKRELRPLGEPIVPMVEAERRIAAAAGAEEETGHSVPDTKYDSWPDSVPASYPAITTDTPRTRLRPRERVARSALIVRLDPGLHRRLEEVARFNRLTMNDIATEAIELHLRNFPHPEDVRDPSG